MSKFFVVLVLVCFASLAQAEVIQFEMTELTGDCSESLKVASLVYHGPAGIVNSVSFRVTGTVSDLGEICCPLYENCPEDTHPWFLTWWGTIEKSDDPDPIYGKWVASTPDYLDQVIPFDQIEANGIFNISTNVGNGVSHANNTSFQGHGGQREGRVCHLGFHFSVMALKCFFSFWTEFYVVNLSIMAHDAVQNLQGQVQPPTLSFDPIQKSHALKTVLKRSNAVGDAQL